MVVKRMFRRDYAGANRVVMRMIEDGQSRRFMVVPALEGVRAGDAGSVEVATRMLEIDPSLTRMVSEAMERLAPWRGFSEIETSMKNLMRQQPHLRIYLRKR